MVLNTRAEKGAFSEGSRCASFPSAVLQGTPPRSMGDGRKVSMASRTWVAPAETGEEPQ